MKMYRLAIITSHPIQYQVPLFQNLARVPEIDLNVYFSWDFGVHEKSYDEEFGQKLKWDLPLLDGYRYKFLKNYSLNPSTRFWGQIDFGIMRELWQNKYDAILVLGWNSLTNWLAFITAFLIETPILLHSENPLSHEFSKFFFKKAIKRIVLGSLFSVVSRFLYIGEENKNFYKYYGVPESKLIFYPYAVDNNRFFEAAKNSNRKSLRSNFGFKNDQVIILFVGKLIDKKRPVDLLNAYENIKNHKKALVFVGEGELRQKLENHIRESHLRNIHLTGFKNQTEVPDYYASADIFVLPSGVGETWGLAVNEAMCFGLPIIVSDLVGCGPDLVKQGENGFIFPIGDVAKLTTYLEELVNNRQKRKSFGKLSFGIIQNYSYEKNIESLLVILRSF